MIETYREAWHAAIREMSTKISPKGRAYTHIIPGIERIRRYMLTWAIARRAELIRERRVPPAGSIQDAAEAVASWYGLTLEQLRQDDNTRATSIIRQHAFAVAYDISRHSYPVVGKIFGRDHTTIIFGVRRHRAAVEEILSTEDA